MSEDEERPGRSRTKLIESKQRWAREGRLLTGRAGDPAAERLPPGQREVRDWPVLDLGGRPSVTAADWRLAVDGLVEQPLALDWQALQDLPQSEFRSDIHCVTAWSRFDNLWRGVATRDLLARVRPRPGARFVICHAYDGYTTNLPLADFAGEDVLLATSWEGRPLPSEHGGPVRVVLPHLYFWKSAKWLRRLELTEADRPGFWEVRGYHNRGDPWTEERYG
jgi:DMSO/TMAO reductase YedYZ molybdopterin-dependent catalytic subunit